MFWNEQIIDIVWVFIASNSGAEPRKSKSVLKVITGPNKPLLSVKIRIKKPYNKHKEKHVTLF